MHRAISIVLLSLATAAQAQFNVIHNFTRETGPARGTGIDNGVVYGYTDLPPVSLETNTPPFFLTVSFNLDGTEFRSVARNHQRPLLGPSTRPLSFADGQFWAFGIDGEGVSRFETATLQDEQLQRGFEGAHPVALGDRIYSNRINFSGPFFELWSSNFDGSDFRILRQTNGPLSVVEPHDGRIFAAAGANAPGTGDPFPGEIFSMNPDGSDYTQILSVDSPIFSLAFGEQGIFGLGRGGLIRVDYDGENFEVVDKTMAGTRIVADEENVYGVAGSKIFRYAQDGSSGVEIIHAFSEGPENSTRPNSDLTVFGSTLFGSTFEGGANDQGIYYSIATDAPSIGGSANPPGGVVPEPSSGMVWTMLLVVFIARQRMRGHCLQ